MYIYTFHIFKIYEMYYQFILKIKNLKLNVTDMNRVNK